MQFHRVHIEITNICGLACSFCPPKLQPTKTMDLIFFEKIIKQLVGKSKSLAFHVMGDPLTLSNLEEYLDASTKHGFQVELTTSGYYLNRTSIKTLFHPAVRQLNISLNSYNKNDLNLSFEEYMKFVLESCRTKVKEYPKPFINLRLWNFDEKMSESEFNMQLFTKLSNEFNVNLKHVLAERPKSIRLDAKVLLHFDNYFEWPSLKSNHYSNGSCYGLQSHFGILANGDVVPCCLDGEGVINLGNLHQTALDDILTSERATTMVCGFLEGKAHEALCQKCSYKDRFTKS